MKICYVVAMRAEAKPFIEHFGVKEVPGFFDPLPCKLYEAELPSKAELSGQGNTAIGESVCDPSDKACTETSNNDLSNNSLPSSPTGGRAGDRGHLYVVLNGEQHGSDLVGCEAASVATMAAISKIGPDLVINSGTCGAFERNGAKIGDVYLGSGVMFHDRRVPGDDAWGTQALGNYPVWGGTSELANRLGLKQGKVTTGSSLDMQPCDEEIIRQNHGELKDMEAAAVAFVCSLYKVPVLLVKSVTDLCDNAADTFETFSKNLAMASEELRKANVRILECLND